MATCSSLLESTRTTCSSSLIHDNLADLGRVRLFCTLCLDLCLGDSEHSRITSNNERGTIDYTVTSRRDAMSFAPAGPSRLPAPRQLHGTRPGVIDSSQPARLLRVPGSTLSFAVFDPLTAASSGTHARKRHDPEPVRPKRIVIETPPGGRGTGRWRFVPRARRAPGVEDEGVWPRRIIIDG